MTESPKPQGPACYTLRIDGHLDDHWSAWFGGLTLTRQSDGTTCLTGQVPDQAALHGLLTKVRDLGATLLSLNTSAGQPQTRKPGSTRDHNVIQPSPHRP